MNHCSAGNKQYHIISKKTRLIFWWTISKLYLGKNVRLQ